MNDNERFSTPAQQDRIEEFLRTRGADQIHHPGGTLLAHLIRVADTLTAWGADPDIRAAGLCHAMYGTDGFDHPLLDLSDRPKLVALIGPRAEALVYLYASCDRTTTYPHLHEPDVTFRDRFTAEEFHPPTPDLQAFLEITAANELDVMTHNPALASRHAQALYRLFDRCSSLLSPMAQQAYRTQLSR